MNPKLIEPSGQNQPARVIALTAGEFLIGRGADCDLRLAASAVSRHHCMIRLQAGEATLLDLGSSNGTYLNGTRVRGPSKLRTGDEIRIENLRFLVDLGDTPGLDLASGLDPNEPTRKLKAPPP
jgi:pSer/pThr/pTyr-binding forkhead associated (FHA) protein